MLEQEYPSSPASGVYASNIRQKANSMRLYSRSNPGRSNPGRSNPPPPPSLPNANSLNSEGSSSTMMSQDENITGMRTAQNSNSSSQQSLAQAQHFHTKGSADMMINSRRRPLEMVQKQRLSPRSKLNKTIASSPNDTELLSPTSQRDLPLRRQSPPPPLQKKGRQFGIQNNKNNNNPSPKEESEGTSILRDSSSRMPFRNRFASAALVSQHQQQQQKQEQQPVRNKPSQELSWDEIAPPPPPPPPPPPKQSIPKNPIYTSNRDLSSDTNPAGIPTHLFVEKSSSSSLQQQSQSEEDDDHHHYLSKSTSGSGSYDAPSVAFSDLSESEYSESATSTITSKDGGGGGGGFSSSFGGVRNQQAHRYTIGQDTLMEVDDEEDHPEDEDEGKIMMKGKQNQNNVQEENDLEARQSVDAYDHQIKRDKTISSRIASLFSNRAPTKQNDVMSQHSDEQEQQEENPEMASSDGRFLSPPKHFSNNIPPVASPTRSNTSGTSSSYVRWPGTVGKNGVIGSSSFSVGDESKMDEVGSSSEHGNGEHRSEVEGGDVIGSQDRLLKKPDTTPARNASDADSGRPVSCRKSEFPRVRSRVAQLKMQFEGDITPVKKEQVQQQQRKEEESTSSEVEESNPADFYLAAVIADVSPPPPTMKKELKSQSWSRESPSAKKEALNRTFPGALGSSKVEKERDTIENPTIPVISPPMIDMSGSLRRVRSTGRDLNKSLDSSPIIRQRNPKSPQFKNGPSANGRTIPLNNEVHLSESALRENDRMTPPSKSINGVAFKGYRGFLDKTKEVPNLIDNETDSITSSSTHATEQSKKLKSPASIASKSNCGDSSVFADSSVFDGLSSSEPGNEQKSQIIPLPVLTTKTPKKTVWQRPERSEDNHDRLIHAAINESSEPEHKQQSQKNSALPTRPAKETVRQRPAERSEDTHDRLIHAAINTARLGIEAVPSGYGTIMHSESESDIVTSDDENVKPRSIQERKKIFSRNNSRNNDMYPLMESSNNQQDTKDDDDDDLSFSSRDDESEASSVPCDLSQFAPEPTQVRDLVKKFRTMSRALEKKTRMPHLQEDAKKAFALFEMRSRIMGTDIERGLERSGGTVMVDDLVLTPHNQAAQRVRDAIIVSKAWRDGANPKDARTAAALTRSERKYYIARQVRSNFSLSSLRSSPNASFDSASSSGSYRNCFSWEQVTWIDDTEFSLLRCPSLGPRSMRGFEMFTIGDCQSILLKLTHERCVELRARLDHAISRQNYAEQHLTEEVDLDNATELDSVMTDAESIYLEAMEDVNLFSSDLELAEKSFHMVREGIEKLVMKYETILQNLDNEAEEEEETISQNSQTTDQKDDGDESLESEKYHAEKQKLSRRAQRAELQAQVAEQEAQMARAEAEKSKQEAERIKAEKQHELDLLQKKLDDLETKSAYMANELELKINNQKLLDNKSRNGTSENTSSAPDASFVLYAASSIGLDQEKQDAKERIKARFRQRNSPGKVAGGETSSSVATTTDNSNSGGVMAMEDSPINKQKLTGRVHQRLEFYERSLQSVQNHDTNHRR